MSQNDSADMCGADEEEICGYHEEWSFSDVVESQSKDSMDEKNCKMLSGSSTCSNFQLDIDEKQFCAQEKNENFEPGLQLRKEQPEDLDTTTAKLTSLSYYKTRMQELEDAYINSRRYSRHLEWHVHSMTRALQNLDGGMEHWRALEAATNEDEKKDYCLCCEVHDLREELHHLDPQRKKVQRKE